MQDGESRVTVDIGGESGRLRRQTSCAVDGDSPQRDPTDGHRQRNEVVNPFSVTEV